MQAIRRFDIRVGDKNLLAGQMSGGQPAEAVAGENYACTIPRVVVIDEPTRGIDIGAKQQIYRSDRRHGRRRALGHRDLLGNGRVDRRLPSDRRDARGSIVGEVAGEAMNEHAIVVLATGVDELRRRHRSA